MCSTARRDGNGWSALHWRTELTSFQGCPMILSSTLRTRRPSRRRAAIRAPRRDPFRARAAIETLEIRWLFDIDEPLGIDGGVEQAQFGEYTPPTPTTLSAT